MNVACVGHSAGESRPGGRRHTFCSSGVTVSVILDLPFGYCVWISSAVAIVYTLLGGLYSVAYTDVIQLALTFFSLVSVSRLLLWKHGFVWGDSDGRNVVCVRRGASRRHSSRLTNTPRFNSYITLSSVYFFLLVFKPSRCFPTVAVRPFPAAQPRLCQHRGDCVQQHLPGAVVWNAGAGRRLEMGGRLLDARELHS